MSEFFKDWFQNFTFKRAVITLIVVMVVGGIAVHYAA